MQYHRPEGALRRTFPSRPESAAQARLSTSTLGLAHTTRARLDLVVTELVTNAIKHARPVAHAEFDRSIDLLVTQMDAEVRVSVHDQGRGFSPADVAAEREVGGLGLLIVDSLCSAWGVDCEGSGSGGVGCTVWCTLVVERAA